MTIRLPVVILCLALALLACWWLLARELVELLPFRGSLFTTLTITLFLSPFAGLYVFINR